MGFTKAKTINKYMNMNLLFYILCLVNHSKLFAKDIFKLTLCNDNAGSFQVEELRFPLLNAILYEGIEGPS